MNLLTVLVASSIINFQLPVHPPPNEHNVDTEALVQVATDYLKIRFSDADFIQANVVDKNNGKDYDVYLAFSADSTPVNTCVIRLHKHDEKKTDINQISCVNYQKKVGFREKVDSTIYY